MRATRGTTLGIMLGAVAFSGCNKDAETKNAVTTETAAGVVSVSPSGDSADKRGQALVRVVNAAPASEGMVVRADDTRLLPEVDFKQVSSYQPIDNNWVKFQVRGMRMGVYESLETNREMLSDGHRYTMVVMRDEKGARYDTRLFRDDISPDGTRAQIRVIHAARGVGNVDVAPERGGRIFEAVGFTSEAGYFAMKPWSGTLEFRAAGEQKVVLTIKDLNLEAGKSYTVVLTNDKTGALTSFWFDDTQM